MSALARARGRLKPAAPSTSTIFVFIALLAAGCFGAARLNAQGRGGGAAPPPRDAVAAPAPVEGTAEIAGVVVSADGGRPVRRATVRLAPGTGPANSRPLGPGAYATAVSVERGAGPLTATTDDAGAFRFEKLPAGQYTLSAAKSGYLTATYGQKRPGSSTPGTPVSLSAGQRLDKLSIPIPRGSVLAGTIVDDAGEPAYGVQVRAFKYVMRGGVRVLEQAGIASSDDRGAYRIPVLTAGDYVIVATPRDDAIPVGEMSSAISFRAVEAVRVGGLAEQFVFSPPPPPGSPESVPGSGYAPVYYPGTTVATAATSVELGWSEERAGLDLRLELVPLGRVAGIVTTPDGRSPAGIEVFLEPAAKVLPGIGHRTARVLADGSFVFNGVAPGTYKLHARSGGRLQVMTDEAGNNTVRVTRTMSAPVGLEPLPGGPPPQDESPVWASGEVTVADGTAPVSVVLSLQPALSVTGRIEFAGSSAPADLARVRIGVTAAAGGRPGESAMGQVTSGREFRVTGVVPGRYRPLVLGLPGWVAKSLEINGRDVLDSALEITERDIAGAVLTLVPELGTLSGTLQDASGRPTASYTVIVAPADPQYWMPQSRRIQATRPATDGRFTFRNLPAGDYRLVAIDDVEPESWFDPEFLRQLVPASVAVVITESGTTVQNVRVAR